ncbi:MAG: hypothetical protein KAQ99_08830 [Candidatus Aureabacteria bacterium]|nr:hypothetical protein [Candidatus Auribacterota bacterium]
MKIEELKIEYANQDNRCTAYPIYVTVQELVCIGVMAEGYGVSCPYGDGETKIEYRHKEDCELSFKSSKKLDKFLCQNNDYTKQDFEEINVGYIWHTVEFFLTIKGAERYIKCNSHNHGKLRTYVHHFERRNFEMKGLLEELGFKIKD